MKFNVTAVAMDRLSRLQQTEPRVETIDTAKNVLFTRCVTALDVEQVYEAFWNDLNPKSEHIVKVISVQRAQQ